MRINQDASTVILAGFWNRMIFSPEWLKQQLDIAGDVGIEMMVAQGQGIEPRTLFDGLRMRVGSQRLVLSPAELGDDATLGRMDAVAVRILEVLSHTPVSAVGVNFQFIEEAPGGELLQLFELPDNTTLADAGLTLQETQIARKLAQGTEVVNFTLTLKSSGHVTIDFNFHADAATPAAAADALRGRVLQYKQRALTLLADSYSLQLD